MKNRNRAILWVFLVFLIGSAFGSTATYLFMGRRLAASGFPKRDPKAIVGDLTDRLGLDEKQANAIREIVQDSRKQFNTIEEEIHQKYGRQFERTRAETRQRIRALLREDQAAKFDQFNSQKDRRQQRKER